MSDIDLSSRPSLAPKVRLQIDTVRGDPVLLYPEGLLILNSTAHEIVSRCDGETPVHALICWLQDEYEAPEDTVRQDVLDILEDLQRRRLIVLSP